MQVKTLSITTTFVQMDNEVGGRSDAVPLNNQTDHSIHRRRRPSKSRPGCVLSFVSALFAGGGVLIAFLGLVLFLRGWTDLVERSVMMSTDEESGVEGDEDLNPNPSRKRAIYFVLYGLLFSVEMLFLVVLLKVVIPLTYTKCLVALNLEHDDQRAHFLQSLVILVAGFLAFGAFQGYLVVQQLAMENNQYDGNVRTTDVGVLAHGDDEEGATPDGSGQGSDHNDDDDVSEFDLSSDEASSDDEEIYRDENMEEEFYYDEDAEILP